MVVYHDTLTVIGLGLIGRLYECPPPHSLRDLCPWPDPTSAGHFGEMIWDNLINASDLIMLILFLELLIGISYSSHMGTFDGKPGNKNLGRLFSKSFYRDMYTVHSTTQWLFSGFLFSKCSVFGHMI